MKRKRLAKILGLILAIGLLAGLLAGCSKSETPAPAQDTAVKKKAVIAYAGGTCEASDICGIP